MTRIAIVTSELAPYHGWGVGTTMSEYARALSACGHEVHVLTDPADGLTSGRVGSCKIHTIDWSSPAGRLAHHPAQSTRRPKLVLDTLRRLHEAHRFDALVFNDFYGDAAFVVDARRTSGAFDGVTIGVIAHSPIFLLREINGQHDVHIESATAEVLERRALAGADVVICPSSAMRDRLADDVDDDKLVVVHNPFDVDSVRDKAGGVEPDPDLVVFAGRLEWRKGAQLLAEASAELLGARPNLRIELVGVDTDASPTGEPVTALIAGRVPEEQRDRFVVLGQRARDEVLSLMARASVVVAPSLWENFPNVCLEAMSLGTPVVASDEGGMREVVEDGRTGLLFKTGDSASLCEAIGRVLDEDALRESAREHGPARVREVCDPARAASGLSEALERFRPGEVGLRLVDEPKVSVIVPVFNMATTVEETVASVLAQTYANIELIVVDDGSTDPICVEVLAELEREGVRLISKPNGGLSSARNAGAAATTGEWVVPLDADDLIDPTFVARCVDAARREPDVSAVSSFVSCFVEKPDQPDVGFVPLGLERDMLGVVNVASYHVAMVKRSVIEEVGGWDESFPAFEDWDFWCGLARRGHRMSLIPEYLVHSRTRRDSMLRSMSGALVGALRAKIIGKHPGLGERPERALRLMLSEAVGYKAALEAK